MKFDQWANFRHYPFVDSIGLEFHIPLLYVFPYSSPRKKFSFVVFCKTDLRGPSAALESEMHQLTCLMRKVSQTIKTSPPESFEHSVRTPYSSSLLLPGATRTQVGRARIHCISSRDPLPIGQRSNLAEECRTSLAKIQQNVT